jgi:hypothetical protein
MEKRIDLTTSSAQLTVRPMKESDIEYIIRYWSDAAADFLERMGVLPSNIEPSAIQSSSLLAEISTPDIQKESCTLVWDIDAKPVGYTKLARIKFGQSGEIHLHLWDEASRGKGFTHILFSFSVREFYKRFQLKEIFCEPAAANPAPNLFLQKLGVGAPRTYETIPFPGDPLQTVNRYFLSSDHFESLCLKFERLGQFSSVAL